MRTTATPRSQTFSTFSSVGVKRRSQKSKATSQRARAKETNSVSIAHAHTAIETKAAVLKGVCVRDEVRMCVFRCDELWCNSPSSERKLKNGCSSEKQGRESHTTCIFW